MRVRVTSARRRQSEREDGLNAAPAPPRLGAVCALDAAGRTLLARAARVHGLSLRAVHRAQRVAWTIADLDGCERVGEGQLHEAPGYRERRGEAGR